MHKQYLTKNNLKTETLLSTTNTEFVESIEQQVPQPDEVERIRGAINRFVEVTTRTLGDDLCSLCLTGSFSAGYFDIHSSDLDFLCITKSTLQTSQIIELQLAYRELKEKGLWWDTRTESVFLPFSYCSNPTPDSSCQYVLRTNGDFLLSQERSDWIVQLYLAKKFGILLAGGTKINEIVPEIHATQLKESCNNAIPFVQSPKTTMQLERITALHVLSTCRLAFTKQTGQIGSKLEAGRWIIKNFPKYATIVEESIQKRGSYREGAYHDAYVFIDAMKEKIANM